MKTIRTAKRLNTVSEYIFSRLAKTVSEVEKKANRKVLNLGPGSPDVRPSEIYLDKLAEYIRKPNAYIYPCFQCIPEFSDSLSGWYAKRFGVDLDTDKILPLLGAKDGVAHLPLALLDAGDEILIPNPGYPAYTDPVRMIGAKPVPYDLLPEHNVAVSLENLKHRVTPRTKALWANFPSNPTGQVAALEDLEELVLFCKKHNIILLYDNAYSEITFDGYVAPSILQVKGAKDIAVEIGSFSKTYSFAGFRMGWIAGNRDIITALAKVKSQMDSGLSVPLQKLGAFALTNFDRKWHEHMILNYQKRRDIIAKKLEPLGLTFSLPKGALYIWAKIPYSSQNSERFCMELLRKKLILLTPGSAFGTNGEGFVRASICSTIDSIDQYI